MAYCAVRPFQKPCADEHAAAAAAAMLLRPRHPSRHRPPGSDRWRHGVSAHRARCLDPVPTPQQLAGPPIARLIAAQYEVAPGSYIAFFSSFDYLEKAAGEISVRHPRIPTWQQGRRMDVAKREAFLARFAVDGCGVGFAVLGGSFAEGINSPGRKCSGCCRLDGASKRRRREVTPRTRRHSRIDSFLPKVIAAPQMTCT